MILDNSFFLHSLKKTAQVFLLLSCSVASMAVLSADTTTGLEAHWEFDNNFSDSSGNNYTLSNSGIGFGTDRNGNGSSATAGSPGSYAFYNSSSIFNNIQTIAYWIKRPNPFLGIFIGAGSGSNVDRWEQYADSSTGEIRNLYLKNSSSQYSFFNFGTNDSDWHHVVTTFGGGGANYYFDGVLVATKPTTQIPDSGFSKFYINTSTHDNDIGANGSNTQLDDVRLYSRRLSAEDILALFQGATDDSGSDFDPYAGPREGIPYFGAELAVFDLSTTTLHIPSLEYLGDNYWLDLKLQESGWYGVLDYGLARTDRAIFPATYSDETGVMTIPYSANFSNGELEAERYIVKLGGLSDQGLWQIFADQHQLRLFELEEAGAGNVGAVIQNQIGQQLILFGEKNISGKLVGLQGVIFADEEGNVTTTFANEEGLPGSLISGDYTFIFTDYTSTTVDISILNGEEEIVFLEDSALNPSALARLVSLNSELLLSSSLSKFSALQSSGSQYSSSYHQLLSADAVDDFEPQIFELTNYQYSLMKRAPLLGSLASCAASSAVFIAAAGATVTTAGVLTPLAAVAGVGMAASCASLGFGIGDLLQNGTPEPGEFSAGDQVSGTLCVASVLTLSAPWDCGGVAISSYADRLYEAEQQAKNNGATVLSDSPRIVAEDDGIPVVAEGTETGDFLVYRLADLSHLPVDSDGVIIDNGDLALAVAQDVAISLILSPLHIVTLPDHFLSAFGAKMGWRPTYDLACIENESGIISPMVLVYTANTIDSQNSKTIKLNTFSRTSSENSIQLESAALGGIALQSRTIYAFIPKIGSLASNGNISFSSSSSNLQNFGVAYSNDYLIGFDVEANKFMDDLLLTGLSACGSMPSDDTGDFFHNAKVRYPNTSTLATIKTGDTDVYSLALDSTGNLSVDLSFDQPSADIASPTIYVELLNSAKLVIDSKVITPIDWISLTHDAVEVSVGADDLAAEQYYIRISEHYLGTSLTNRNYSMNITVNAGSSTTTTPGQVITNQYAGDMVVIPAGSFQMGGTRFDNEGPVHQVTISKPFAMSRTEVTFKQYDAYVVATGAVRLPFHGDDNPASGVSWDQTQGYIQWLNQQTGNSYRLPTEAEWEYAARAGSSAEYSWGYSIGNNNANCDGCGSQWDKRQTAPVGSFSANAFGLYDMNGNALEWVQDCYVSSYANAPVDGSASEQGSCRDRVQRGGSWFYTVIQMRSSYRFRNSPSYRGSSNGFRLVQDL